MSFHGLSPIRFGSVSMVTATLGTNDPEVGTVCDFGADRYIFVYNVGSSTIGVGSGAVLSGVSGYSVTVSSVTHTDIPVGVCKHVAIPTGSYGWLLQRGFSTAQAGSAVATANGLTLGADGTWQAQLTTTAYSQVNLPTVYGKAMGSAASSASFAAYFRIA
jgi:hypothetical protein